MWTMNHNEAPSLSLFTKSSFKFELFIYFWSFLNDYLLQIWHEPFFRIYSRNISQFLLNKCKQYLINHVFIKQSWSDSLGVFFIIVKRYSANKTLYFLVQYFPCSLSITIPVYRFNLFKVLSKPYERIWPHKKIYIS